MIHNKFFKSLEPTGRILSSLIFLAAFVTGCATNKNTTPTVKAVKSVETNQSNNTTPKGLENQNLVPHGLWSSYMNMKQPEKFRKVVRPNKSTQFNWNLKTSSKNSLGAVFSGLLVPPKTAHYTFRVDTTEKAQLLVDGRVVQQKQNIKLEKDKKYWLQINLKEINTSGQMRLLWSTNQKDYTNIPAQFFTNQHHSSGHSIAYSNTNLITNPGFEDGIEGWELFDSFGDFIDLVQPGHNSQHALKIAVDDGTNWVLPYARTNIVGKGDTKYTLSFDISTDAAARCRVVLWGATPQNVITTGATPYTNYKIEYTTPDLEDYPTLTIDLGNVAMPEENIETGNCLFDNVRLVEGDDQGNHNPQPVDPIDGTSIVAKVKDGFSGLEFSEAHLGSDMSLELLEHSWNSKSHVMTARVALRNNGSTTSPVYRLVFKNKSGNLKFITPNGYTSGDLPYIEYIPIEPTKATYIEWKIYSPQDQIGEFYINALPAHVQKLDVTSVSPSKIENDTENIITIQGQNIRAETAFFIESTRLKIKNWTPTSAEVVVPEEFPPATYGIMAVNPDGGKSVLYPAVTVSKGFHFPFPMDPKSIPRSFVDGFVIDIKTKKPIAGATVGIPNLTTTSDEDGYFLLRGVPEGRQAIAIEAPNYEKVYRFAEVRGKAQTITLKLAELEPKSTAVTNIGPDGGWHHANDGSMLYVPAGALDVEVPISFTQLSGANALPELPQDGYYLAFARLAPLGLTFKQPATLFLPLQPGIVLENDTPIRISYYDEREQRWVQDITGGIIVTHNDKQYLKYEINHFTWIGGQFFSEPVTGCVKYSDGSPAAGIVTNYGVTGLDGNFAGSTTRSSGVMLNLRIAGSPSLVKVNKLPPPVKSNKANFSCAILETARKDFVKKVSFEKDGCRPLSVKGIERGSRSSFGDTIIDYNIITNNRKNISLVMETPIHASSIDFSKTSYTVNGSEKFESLGISRNQSSKLTSLEDQEQKIKTGLNEIKIKASHKNKNVTINESTLYIDNIHQILINDIKMLVLEDSEVPSDITTPYYVNRDDITSVILRRSQVDSGNSAKIDIGIRSVDESGKIVKANLEGLKFMKLGGRGYLKDGIGKISVEVPLSTSKIVLGGVTTIDGIVPMSGDDCNNIKTSNNKDAKPSVELVDYVVEKWRQGKKWWKDDLHLGWQILISLVPVVPDVIDLVFDVPSCISGGNVLSSDCVFAVWTAVALGTDAFPVVGASLSALKKPVYYSEKNGGSLFNAFLEAYSENIAKDGKVVISRDRMRKLLEEYKEIAGSLQKYFDSGSLPDKVLLLDGASRLIVSGYHDNDLSIKQPHLTSIKKALEFHSKLSKFSNDDLTFYQRQYSVDDVFRLLGEISKSKVRGVRDGARGHVDNIPGSKGLILEIIEAVRLASNGNELENIGKQLKIDGRETDIDVVAVLKNPKDLHGLAPDTKVYIDTKKSWNSVDHEKIIKYIMLSASDSGDKAYPRIVVGKHNARAAEREIKKVKKVLDDEAEALKKKYEESIKNATDEDKAKYEALYLAQIKKLKLQIVSIKEDSPKENPEFELAFQYP